MTERQIAAKRCVEITSEVAEDLGRHSDPAWNAAEEIEYRIKKEFGLETEDAKT